MACRVIHVSRNHLHLFALRQRFVALSVSMEHGGIFLLETPRHRFKDPFVRTTVSVSPLIARENSLIFSPPSPRVLFLRARHFSPFFKTSRNSYHEKDT